MVSFPRVLALLAGVGISHGLSYENAKAIAGGVVEGFLSDGTDMKQCMEESRVAVHSVEHAVEHFEKEDKQHVLAGLKELSQALSTVPNALKDCKATQSDFENIMKALKAFNSPESFVVHVGKNVIVDGRDIYTEINTAVTDYRQHKYKDFGVQVGIALHKLIVGLTAMPVEVAKEMSIGVVEGFLGEESDTKECIVDSMVVGHRLEDAVRDFEIRDEQHVLAGLKELSQVFNTLPNAFKACKASQLDLKHIIKALKAFYSPESFVFHVGKDLLVNGKDIYSEIDSAFADYSQHKFKDFGLQVGTALRKLVVGFVAMPVEQAKEISIGVVEGFLSQGSEMKECIEGSTVVVHSVEDAVKDFEIRDEQHVLAGLKELSQVFNTLPSTFKTCKASHLDLKHIIRALKVFDSPESFVFHLGKDLLINGKDIYTEIYTAVADYHQHEYKDFGLQVGMALRKFSMGADTAALFVV